MSEEKMIPKIRFVDFDKNWAKIRAKEIFKSISEKNCNHLPMLSATQKNGMVDRESLDREIQYKKSNLNNYKKVQKGQYVIHLRSFEGGFAYANITGITSPAYTVIDFKDERKHDEIFWKEIFKSYNFIKLLEKVTYGVRDGRSISFQGFSTLKFSFPHHNEQQKIGNLFKKIDQAISLQQQVLETTKKYKQSMLQKMFPKKDEKVPEIRFKRFNEDWAKNILEECVKSIPSKHYISKGETLSHGTHSVIQQGMIQYWDIVTKIIFMNNIKM